MVGVPSLDVLAKALDCGVYPCQRIKLFNRLLVEGEPVQIVSPWAVKPEVMQGLTLSQPDNNGPKSPVVHIAHHLGQHKGEPRLYV